MPSRRKEEEYGEHTYCSQTTPVIFFCHVTQTTLTAAVPALSITKLFDMGECK